ncbi:MarR family winged helix-turn-helix transcriptional regulator [Paenibacillus lacisoli]|uniref:MarR family winged helix-turn-helix transcriptional regulator n=1 Tax=Paenibacillus lacisoli TaxID=3064525 RepID=UPI0031F2DCF1
MLKKKIFYPVPASELPMHLSHSNIQVLVVLHEVRISSVSELSKQLNVSRPNMTPLLDKLVELELVDRKSCDSDRRVVNVEITPKGDTVCREMRDMVADKIEQKLATLNPKDLTELETTLCKLKGILLKIDNHPV